MPNEVEKSVACVEFALRKLEDVWNVEASLLSGATSLSEAGALMVLAKPMLEKIQLVLVDTASAPSPCWENSDDDQQSAGAGAGVMKWITAVVHVCIYIESVVLKFSIKAGETIPIERLPEAVKRISTKPIDLFNLNWLAIEMRKIQSQLHSIINDNAFRQPDATLRAFPQPAQPSPQMELVGYEALQKTIIDKLLDPTPERLEVAILGPEAAGKTAFLEKIYQSNLVKNHFDVCFWFFHMNCFDYRHPEQFKPIDILRKMLITLEPGNSLDVHDDNVVVQMICESLKAKRYLVVIDNVQRYNVFKQALSSENNGSRVLIASQEMGNYERICLDLDLDPEVKHPLPSLSIEERLTLIFGNPSEKKDSLEEYPPDFLPTARIIATSSIGDSPMNLLLLRGHILFNQPRSHNLQVLGDIAAAANFSEFLTTIYNKLPRLLRICFAYMATLFPVNYLIHANSLIRLWIAEGMIPKEDGRTMEQTANLYLDELIQRGFVRGISAYYHNQPNQIILVVAIHPKLQSGLFDNYTGVIPPIEVILGEAAVDISGCYGEADDNHANLEYLHRLALHSSYEYDQFSSFQEGKIMLGFKYPGLHSLFFFGSVAPLMYSKFNFLRVLVVFQARIQFSEEDRSCWLKGLNNLRYLGFIVCWVEGSSLGKTLSRLTNLQTLDLSESFVSGLSEFMEHNTKVNVIGPIKEELLRCWSPVPDMIQLTSFQQPSDVVENNEGIKLDSSNSAVGRKLKQSDDRI